MKLNVGDLNLSHTHTHIGVAQGSNILACNVVSLGVSKDNSAFVFRIKQSRKGWAILGLLAPVKEGTTTI